jgi:hypothetical protein
MPSEKQSYYESLCVNPNEDFWLQRRYDSKGAWVDVEKA